MRVIHITASYKPAYVYGGPIMSVAKLCESLKGLELEVLTTTANGKDELIVPTHTSVNLDSVKVNYFKRITKDHSHFSPALLWRLNQEITNCKKNKQPLIIHIHAWWNLVSILSCWVAVLRNVPVVLSPRGMVTAYTLSNRNGVIKKLIHKFLGKKLLTNCHIHATSKIEQDEFLKFIKPKSIQVIPNLVELPDTKFEYANAENEPFKLLFLSRIEEKKGLELLFKALAKISFSFQLQIAGDGETAYVEHLKNIASELNISKNITWLGHVNNANKYDLIAQNHLFVLTSFNENFANVVVESLHVGTPVLISKFVGLADFVQQHNLGWVCDLDVENITKNLEHIYQNKKDLTRINSTAPLQIAQNFNSEVLAQQYIKLYKNLIKN